MWIIAPTSLGLCGIDIPEWMDGNDCSRYRIKKNKKNQKNQKEIKSVYVQSIHPTYHSDSCDKAWRGIVTKDGWKYACFNNTDWLMFNLKEDPEEMMNLAHVSGYRDKKKELREELRYWIERTLDDFQVPVD